MSVSEHTGKNGACVATDKDDKLSAKQNFMSLKTFCVKDKCLRNLITYQSTCTCGYLCGCGYPSASLGFLIRSYGTGNLRCLVAMCYDLHWQIILLMQYWILMLEQ